MQNETGHMSALSEHFKAFKPRLEVRRAPYRMVFTMKRTITASPTQPHIAPMTMAVTSPAEGGDRAGPRPTGVHKSVTEADGRVRRRLSVWEGFRCVLTRGELLPRLYKRWKERNERDCRKPLCTLERSSGSAGSRLGPVWLPNHSAFDPQAFLFTRSLTHHTGQRIFRLPRSHLRLSIRFAGQQYSRCFISVNPPS